MRNAVKTALNKGWEDYILQKVADAPDLTSIWKILTREGLTSSQQSLATTMFTTIELNNFYCSTARAHPPCSLANLNAIIALPRDNANQDEFCFRQYDVTEIYDAVILHKAKSRGRSADDLPLKYCETFLPTLVPFITKLFNHSIHTCSYPNAWKRAYIVPLCKVHHPQTPSQTRPIANLPHLAKIFDKLQTQQMLQYLESNNMLCYHQYGFRANHSTQAALLHLTDAIRNGIEHGMITVLMLFDFRKAFDTISHESLLISLRKLGFSPDALKWTHSYLTNRSQAVIDGDGGCSEFTGVTSGVPQGSSPGPIFFSALINSLPKCLKFCKDSYILFADDLQIFVQCPANVIAHAFAHLNEDARAITGWAKQHGIKLNAEKTKAIIFGSPFNLREVDVLHLPPLIVDGETIEIVHKVKSLGVWLTSDLTWNAQVSAISAKVHGTLHKLRRRGWRLPQHVKTILVQALIMPHIDYACLVYNHVPQYLNLKLQRMVNAGIRYIFNLRRDEHISRYRQQLNWLRVELRRLYFMGCVTFNVLNTGRPIYHFERLTRMFRPLRRSARIQGEEIALPNSRTLSHKQSFNISAAINWSNIPIAIRNARTVATFKTLLYDHMLSTDFLH